MSRRTIAFVLLFAINLPCLVGMIWSVFGNSQVSFTQSELQQRLNQQLPRTVKGVTIDRVDVALADNKLSLRASLQGQVVRQTVAAVVEARGAPRYNAEAHEIYFDADRIAFDRIVVAGKTIPPAEAAKNPLAAAAIATTEQAVEQAGKEYLAALPVYRFKDDFKGYVMKSALAGVAVTGDRLVIELSLWKLTVTTATFAFWLIVGLVFLVLLLRFPLWGTVSSISIGDP